MNGLREQVNEVETYYNQLKNLLQQAEEKLAKKNLDPASVVDYTIKVFKSPRASK